MKNIIRIALITASTAGTFLLAISAAHAADVKQTVSASSGQSWATASIWENSTAAAAGNNYFTNGYILRTPDSANGTSTFPESASLTVDGGVGGQRGTLSLKSGTTKIENLLLGIGTVSNAVNNGSSNLAATLIATNLTVLATATASAPANLQGSSSNNNLTASITNLLGSGYLQFANPRTYSLSVANASAFTGTLHLNEGTLNLTSNFTATSASFTMASAASLVLTSNLTVASFTFGPNAELTGGSYTSAELNALFSTTKFSGDGIVSIGSIPEVSAMGFWLGGAFLSVGLFARLRRK